MYKIYKLTFPTGDVYIGSSKQSLNVRYGTHRSDAKNRKVKTYKDELCLKYYFSEVQMVEIDSINLDTTKEVRILEQKWIDKHPDCLNSNKAYSTKEETRIKALEHIKIYNKEYYKRPEVIIKKKEYEKQAYLKRKQAGYYNN